MNISDYGVNFIKEFEGCVLHAYKPVPYESWWTIGYGHTDESIQEGDTISAYEAEKYLRADLVRFEQEVNAWNYHYKWTQNEFDAMVSFAYNCGEQNFRNLIKHGDRTKGQIAEAMLLYVHDSGDNVLDGLVTRRQRERSLFLCPDELNSESSPNYETVDDIVDAIWNGEFGNDEERKENLYNYFQDLVNKRGR